MQCISASISLVQCIFSHSRSPKTGTSHKFILARYCAGGKWTAVRLASTCVPSRLPGPKIVPTYEASSYLIAVIYKECGESDDMRVEILIPCKMCKPPAKHRITYIEFSNAQAFNKAS
ncbi:hypothetical protein C5167_020659, partial [Papaver somniferum]